MRNLLVTISYLGKNYHGWQIQTNALTVQEVFQRALFKLLKTDYLDIKGCSRTDTGVNAKEYCISFKTENSISEKGIVKGLNSLLPDDIRAVSAKEVPLDFHARYSSKGKQYTYRIWNGEEKNPFFLDMAMHYRWKLDEEKMNEAAKCFIGTHDYIGFSSQGGKERDTVKTITRAEVTRKGDFVTFVVEGDGFLYNMVRIMVGTLIKISAGRITKDNITKNFEIKDRKLAGETVPPQGLFLTKVIY